MVEDLREAQSKQGDILELQTQTVGSESGPFYITLGSVTDAQLDGYSIEFEGGDNRYVSFNEANMTLDID